jgi:hypothetical protein
MSDYVHKEIVVQRGIKRDYYSIKTSKGEYSFDINFPKEWAISDAKNRRCGPSNCFQCQYLMYKGVFVHYCNSCLTAFIENGEKRGKTEAFLNSGDSWLWLRFPYMSGVKVSDIGKTEKQLSVKTDPNCFKFVDQYLDDEAYSFHPDMVDFYDADEPDEHYDDLYDHHDGEYDNGNYDDDDDDRYIYGVDDN